MTSPSTPVMPPPDVRDDATLLRGSVAAPEAFEEIFRRHARAIFAFACARVGPDHAEDVTAETFSAAFERRATFDATADSARPWLYGIAANKLHQHHDSERRWLDLGRRAVAELDDVPDESATDDRVDARRRLPALLLALAELSPAERDVLVLHVLAGLSHREIAASLGIRRGTAKVRLSRGCARLRDALEEEGHGDD